jgi:L-fuculose-phosphate aldolase
MFAVAHQPIPAAIDEFVVYIGGDVPVCEYHPSGSDKLGEVVAAALGDRSAALMVNHGLVTIGKSVEDALHSALVVEHNAEIVWGARLLGGVIELPDKAKTDFAGVYDFIRHQTWRA